MTYGSGDICNFEISLALIYIATRTVEQSDAYLRMDVDTFEQFQMVETDITRKKTSKNIRIWVVSSVRSRLFPKFH